MGNSHLSLSKKYLITLDYSNQKLEEIPDIPKGIQLLYLNNNLLKKLPKSLIRLWCRMNLFEKTPRLPKVIKINKGLFDCVMYIPKLNGYLWDNGSYKDVLGFD